MLTYEEKRIPLAQIDPEDKTFCFRMKGLDARKLATLAASIEELGLLHPLVVLKNGRKYAIVAGFRRHGALSLLAEKDPKWADVPCRIVTGDLDEMLQAAADENRERKSVSPLEMALTIVRLSGAGKTYGQIGRILRLNERSIQRYVSLFKCVDEVKNVLHEGGIETTHAYLLAGVPAGDQKRLLKAILEKGLSSVDLVHEIRKLKAKRSGAKRRWELLANSLPEGAKFKANGQGKCQLRLELAEPKDEADFLAKLKTAVARIEASLAEAATQA